MRKLFTLLTAVLASASAWAQFDEPELQKATQVKIDGTTEYYMSITNSEGEEYFYGKGNNWGTRTSAKMDQADALVIRFHANPTTIDGVEYTNTVKFNNYVSDKGGWGAFADCDGGLQAWVDGQGRTGDGRWIVTDKDNGQIQLENVNAAGGLFSFTPTRAQWSEDDQDYILVESEDGYGFDNRLWFVGARVDSVDVLQYDEDGLPAVDEEGNYIPTGEKRAAISYGDEVYSIWQLWDASLYNARMQFVNWYWNDYDEEGNAGADLCDMYESVNKAVEAAQAVYDNPDATVEELNAAYAAIIAAVDLLAVENNRDVLEGATAEEPIDLFVEGIAKNADFGGVRGTDGNLDGWTANLRGNDNHRQNDEYSNNGVKISGFAESWTWNSSHSAGYGEFSQKVGLPAGLYILGVDMIATQQSSNKEGSKGVELFAKSATQEFAIPVATGNNAPEHFEIAFTAEDGTFTIGVRENNTTCNWIAMDNWSLNYYGKTDKPLEQIDLGKVIVNIGAKHDGYDEIVAHKDAIEEYDNAFDAASEAYENGGLADPSEYTVLGDSLTSKYNKLVTSINDYRFFKSTIATVEERAAEFEGTPCGDEIADYLAELQDAYDKAVDGEGDWTRAQMDEILGKVSEIMGKYTDVKPGDDVTFYLNNPKFTENFSGWNVVGANPGYSKNHGQGENANADLCQEVPEENDGLAECFHALFDMSQTIKNLPAGLYTLSVQGFDRSDDGVNEPAELYATFSDGTEQTVNIANIDDYMTEDRLYVKNNADGNPEWMSDAGRNGDTYWVPNGMTGAAWHFVNKKDGENYDYTNKFKILMKEAGDLTVGVRVKNTHQWVIWDNFTLVYEGSGTAVWIPTLEEEMAALDTKCAEAEITTGEYEAIQDVIEEAEAFIKNINDVTEDDCAAMLEKLKAQEAEIPANIQLQKDIQSFYDQLYSENITAKAEEADAELAKRYEDICNIVDGDYDDLDNEGLKKAVQEAKDVIAALKMPKGWEDASDENPVDFSELIANRFFNVDGSEDPEFEPAAVQNHNFTEWQGKQPGTGGGEAANCGEVWNSGAYEMHQDIVGLPEGTYILSCQGFLRHGGGTEDSYKILNGDKEQTVYAYLGGVSSVDTCSVELKNIASVQLTQAEIDSLGITGGNSKFNNNTFIGADQLSCADGFFKAGFYKNELTVKVGADGVLRISIEKIGAVGQDWVVVDNFSLFYLGKNSSAESSEDQKTAIDNVQIAAQKAIFTITGLRVNKMAKPGLYIVNGKKVLVK